MNNMDIDDADAVGSSLSESREKNVKLHPVSHLFSLICIPPTTIVMFRFLSQIPFIVACNHRNQ